MKQILTIYILDDDPVILEAVGREIQGYMDEMPEYEAQISRFQSGGELLRHLDHVGSLDLLLTDIDLGRDDSGIAVARQVRQRFPQCGIIYLTAFLSYATEIYETRPLYFILKEEYRERIPKAMELFVREYQSARGTLTVMSGREQQVIELSDIRYMEHVDRKTEIVLGDRRISVGDTIPELMEKLPEGRFSVCHRGYIVNLAEVQSFRRFEITLDSGERIPISRARFEPFQRAFSEYLTK